MLKFENGEYYAGECKVKGEKCIRKVVDVEKAKKYAMIYRVSNGKRIIKERYNLNAEIAKFEDEEQNLKRSVKLDKPKIDPRTECKVLAMVDNCIRLEKISDKLGLTKEEIFEVLKNNNYVIKENNTLKSQLKEHGLDQKHLKVKGGKFHISYIYWKGTLINKVPNGIAKDKLLQEKGTYTLNMILDVEKSLNEH